MKKELITYFKGLLSKELKIDPEKISEKDTFYDLGLDSVNSIFLIHEIEEKFNVDIDPIAIYDNPTLSSFSAYINQLINEDG